MQRFPIDPPRSDIKQAIFGNPIARVTRTNPIAPDSKLLRAANYIYQDP